VDPCLKCDVSPGFKCFTDPTRPLKRWHVSPAVVATCPLRLVMCHLWKLPIGPCSERSNRDPLVFFVASSTSLHARVDPLGLRDSRGLGCKIVGKVKGPKVIAMWRDSETSYFWNTVSRVSRKARRSEPHGDVLGSFESSRIQESGGHVCRKEKGCSVPNTKFSSSFCVR
jgi:hypothetical protein